MSVILATLAASGTMLAQNTTPTYATPEAVSKRMRITRMALDGISQADIARQAGMSAGAWNNAETGQSKLSINQALKLFDRFGIDPTWIYYGNTMFLPEDFKKKVKALTDDPLIRYQRP